MNIREIILDILLELEKTDGYVNLLLADVLEKYDYLAPKEKAFIKRVTQGTVERRIQIDFCLNTVSKVPVPRMKPLIRQLLRMSACQILFMDSVPDAAVCNEAVKLAQKRKFVSLKGYVNGVLRSLSRQKDQIIYPDTEKEEEESLSVRYSMPPQLVRHFVNEYGKETAEKIMSAFLERCPVTLRLEERLSEAEKSSLYRAWEEKGAVVRQHPLLPYAVCIERAEGVSSLSGYEEGLFAVQDVSSMLAVEAADIQKGQTVIDLCAAPGGKSLHAASKLSETGRVLSFDISEKKLCRMEENRKRMRKENVRIQAGDACIFREELAGTADVVLADVPCSGLGVIGKKQDIKYHVTMESMEQITLLQKEILQNAASYVKTGGILLYSTCTLNPQENEMMVRWFCERFPFTPEDMSACLPEPLKKAGKTGMIQLIPGIHETDGFFFARLRRKAEAEPTG